MKLIFIVLVLLVLLGVYGKATTSGYPCHWIQVGDSQVCQ